MMLAPICYQVIITACFVAFVQGSPALKNITIAVPEGSSNHEDPNLLCVPIKWYQILIFFTVNYFSHAATVKSVPGQKWHMVALDVVAALIFPYSGVTRAYEVYWRWSWPSDGDLLKAARVGALCAVVRNEAWVPKVHARGQANNNGIQGSRVHQNDSATKVVDLFSFETQDSPSLDTKSEGMQKVKDRTVHGYCSLPDGYELAFLPSNANVEMDCKMDQGEAAISSSYNVPKAIIAIVQTVYASITLYRTRGDQIQRYGYASFGLTVIPYIIMSIMNLCGNMIVPDYPTLYLVRSLESDEAKAAGGAIDGTVGHLDQSASTLNSPKPGRSGIFEMDDDQTLVFRFDESELNLLNSDDKRNGPFQEAAKGDASDDVVPRIVNDERVLDHEIHVPALTPFKTTGGARWTPSRDIYMTSVSLFFIGAIPYAIIGGLTHFDPGQSTLAQRVWTMMWLTFGVVVGTSYRHEPFPTGSHYNDNAFHRYISSMVLYYAPAVGGFVVVGQMLQAYGSCLETS